MVGHWRELCGWGGSSPGKGRQGISDQSVVVTVGRVGVPYVEVECSRLICRRQPTGAMRRITRGRTAQHLPSAFFRRSARRKRVSILWD